MRWTRVGEMIPNSTRTGGRSCRFVYVPSLCFGLCVFGTDLRRRTNEEAVQRVNKYFTRMPCPLKESSNGTHGPEGKGSSTLIRISGRARIALPKLLPPPSTHWCRRIIYYSFSAEQFFPLPLSRSEKGEKKCNQKMGEPCLTCSLLHWANFQTHFSRTNSPKFKHFSLSPAAAYLRERAGTIFTSNHTEFSALFYNFRRNFKDSMIRDGQRKQFKTSASKVWHLQRQFGATSGCENRLCFGRNFRAV